MRQLSEQVRVAESLLPRFLIVGFESQLCLAVKNREGAGEGMVRHAIRGWAESCVQGRRDLRVTAH